MMGYLVWFNVTEAPDIINSPYNKRVDNQETKVVRGDILAADGSILATTETDEDGNETTHTETVTETILEITITHKTPEEKSFAM